MPPCHVRPRLAADRERPCVARQLDISYDAFIRTTDAKHEARAALLTAPSRRTAAGAAGSPAWAAPRLAAWPRLADGRMLV